MPVLFNIGDVRTRHCNNLSCENTKSFSNDPEDPSAAALKVVEQKLTLHWKTNEHQHLCIYRNLGMRKRSKYENLRHMVIYQTGVCSRPL